MRRLGPYELLQRIGSGGMAEVWMGRRTALAGASKAVAVKLPTGQVADDPDLRHLFLKEAELSMLLSHSTVVQVFDAGEHEGRPYLVMEWVDGMNLAQLQKNLAAAGRRLPLPVGAFVIGEVLRALAYAHTVTHDGAPLGVVHRDVSPQNVLVSVSGEVKLTDFGVARVAREDTSGMHVKGKLRYMAPEQLSGQSRAPTVDLYAVGAMLHEILDGQKFRRSRDEAHLYGMVLSGEIPALESTDVPRELDALRVGLLQKDVERRIPSAERALELLMRWPGYANCSMALARLCRSLMGVAAPRSGIHTTPGAQPAVSAAQWLEAASVSGTAATLTAPERRAAEAAAQSPSPSPSGPAQTVTLTRAAGASGGGGAAHGPTSHERARLGRGVAVGAGGLALLGLFGALGWQVWGRGDASEAVTVAEAPATVEAAQLTAPRPAETELADQDADHYDAQGRGASAARSVTSPRPTSSGPPATRASAEVEARSPSGAEPPVATESSVEGSDEDPSEATPESASGPEGPGVSDTATRPVRRARIPVTFKASQFDFVFVKVGRRELTLEPNARVQLPAGKHQLRFRTRSDAPWTRAGSFEIEPGGRYEVRMTRPGGFTIERQG